MKNKLKIISVLSTIALAAMLTAACSQDEAKPANTATKTESAATETTAKTAEIKTMTGEELVAQNSDKKKDEVLIIDVRSADEYKAGHIPNAININIDEFEGRLAELKDYKDKPIIAYCNSGKKSGQAAEILVNNGFQDVTNAQGVKEFKYDLVQYEDVRGEAFQTLIDENKDIVLVDVRPAKQVEEEGMIEGAINVPFDEVEAYLDQLPKRKTIALYCNTGTKSAEVAKHLESLGYENIVNSIEGVKEYPFELDCC
ncbi:rhodanese-like domain-containing protein [Bacillus benzoevorans]|uniref:Rhodanese-related sulfurtransferase n=1 Tax=Bacillus benzoevorans TaxID=1456 RepID=A0A7X0LVG1_9BACI|nr:rhodanese-like domain-containing protein [Bacillus benzoevorans]MBB6445588.1 rhodanese-related sulfurtransferase [Bacillus benzoevorans]